MSENPKTFFDIKIGDEKVGRIVFELYEKEAPKTVENFEILCTAADSFLENTPLKYKNNYFHRVVKNFAIQAGDVFYCSGDYEKTDNTGKGGCSIYASTEQIIQRKGDSLWFGNFEDENLKDFDKPFYLAMANKGEPNTNNSQIFITTSPAPHLNGKHTLFGRVLYGKSVVRTIENTPVDSDGFPESCVRIINAGKWEENDPVPLYNASNDSIGGDIYEEFPDDNENFDEDNFSVAYEAAKTIKESGTLLFKRKDYQNAFFKYKKSLRYVNEYIPEESIDKENCTKFSILKMKLYLNLSLVLYNLQKYDDSIKYATYLLELENVPEADQAKAFYRRGNSLSAKKKWEESLADYKACRERNTNDKVVLEKIEQVERELEKREEKAKQTMSKFFTEGADSSSA
ncbi:CPR7 (YJR032W) [Zygosaccharomyces parabailii]|uniref:peptidylprolyl isomerase n=1 Tax=Zygosaccharomyces bailii (strain CLIB 213 / ATCC 58445 / CBS 680 / BCRC 21525 / NBRC 1098 / NCYC 1416 / NRRL Y-2227) TaxID=1333698 RepID=A0A8J2T7P5_ZYGB2|nr:CPR7 (YJR032W) [Zygosaccharomyces parabailii]CDF90216.1 ZYBA0S06-03422g1_1 [Zygosaccharomyces bailii CLIB 213]